MDKVKKVSKYCNFFFFFFLLFMALLTAAIVINCHDLDRIYFTFLRKALDLTRRAYNTKFWPQ